MENIYLKLNVVCAKRFASRTFFSGLERTENCVSILLDNSVKHSFNFDWVIAHLGSAFPDTIVARILNVGLKEFVKSADKVS